MLPSIATEEGIIDATKKYGAIPGEILKKMRQTGMVMTDWEIEGEEPELPQDITKLTHAEVKVLYDEFSLWYGRLKQRRALANLEYRAAKKICSYVEKYLRITAKGAEEYAHLTAEERKIAVQIHPDYIHWDREEEFWRALQDTLDERIAVISHSRDRVFREDRSRDNIGPGRSRGISDDDFLGA